MNLTENNVKELLSDQIGETLAAYAERAILVQARFLD